jgi:hypothetical protein
MLPERGQILLKELLHYAGPVMLGDPWASENMGRLVALTGGRDEAGASSSCGEWGPTARRYAACQDKRSGPPDPSANMC